MRSVGSLDTGFVNTVLLYISCDVNRIWSPVSSSCGQFFRKLKIALRENVEFVMLWFLTFLSTESEFSINAAASAEATIAQAAYVDNHFGPG